MDGSNHVKDVWQCDHNAFYFEDGSCEAGTKSAAQQPLHETFGQSKCMGAQSHPPNDVPAAAAGLQHHHSTLLGV